jgi:hypothetical protein
MMDKSKVPIIILVILFLGSSFFTFRFYTESQTLFQEKEKLAQEKEDLTKRIDKYKGENRLLISENKDLSGRLKDINTTLDRLQAEKEQFRVKYEAITQERDTLVDQIQQLRESSAFGVVSQPMVVQKPTTAPSTSDEYWQDMLQKKAQLQINVEDLATKLRAQTAKVKKLGRTNESLTIELEDLKKIKTELDRKMTFNSRTIEIITKDLVREREDRKDMMNELDKLKEENVSLARELKLAKKQGRDLEDLLGQTKDERANLQTKVRNVETIMKEKALEINSLQRQLSGAISSSKAIMPREEEISKAVELPPIVVKSEAQTYTRPHLEGKALAVNSKERFVIIDLGQSAGLKPGDEFLVMRSGIKMGTLEVIETRQDIAACDIKDMQGVIKEGDIVSFQP